MSEERIKERCKRKDIALKVVRGFLEKDCDEDTELYYSLQTLLNLIDKQQKEIEKLKKKKQDVMNYIEYYLVGNYRLERAEERDTELRKIIKMLEE